MGFKTTLHDYCIYRNIINGDVVYLLRQVDNSCAAYQDQKMAENTFNILGTKMRFESVKEKDIILFEFLIIMRYFNVFYINQTSW